MTQARPSLPREFLLAHRRPRILAAIAGLVAEGSYEAMTITDIAKRARIARKTLYESYGGKEEAFLAAVDAAFAAVFVSREEACADFPEDEWRERIGAALEALLDHLADHPAEAHMMVIDAPAATTASAARYQAATARFTELLHDAVPVGRDRSETIAETVVGGVAWILNRQVRRGEIERVRDLLPELTEFVLAPWSEPGSSSPA